MVSKKILLTGAGVIIIGGIAIAALGSNETPLEMPIGASGGLGDRGQASDYVNPITYNIGFPDSSGFSTLEASAAPNNVNGGGGATKKERAARNGLNATLASGDRAAITKSGQITGIESQSQQASIGYNFSSGDGSSQNVSPSGTVNASTKKEKKLYSSVGDA